MVFVFGVSREHALWNGGEHGEELEVF